MAEMNGLVNGRPVDPQVMILMGKYGEIERGTEVTHGELAAAIGEHADSTRYRTVLNAWRKRMLEQRGIEFMAVPKVGLRACAPGEQLYRGSVRSMKSIERKAKRSALSVGVLKDSELDDAGRSARNFAVHTLTAIASESKRKRRELDRRENMKALLDGNTDP
jgi:hypothetical protein